MSDAKDWQDLSDDEILNYQGPGDYLGVMYRYDRIMAHKTVMGLGQVWAGLFDVKKAMHHTADQLERRLKAAEELQKQSSAAQTKLQRVTLWLTLVIAAATVAYTWITWESVKVQREANQIQRDAAAKPK